MGDLLLSRRNQRLNQTPVVVNATLRVRDEQLADAFTGRPRGETVGAARECLSLEFAVRDARSPRPEVYYA